MHYISTGRIATSLVEELQVYKCSFGFSWRQRAPLWEKELPGVNLEDLPCETNSHENEHLYAPLPVWYGRGGRGGEQSSWAVFPTSSADQGLPGLGNRLWLLPCYFPPLLN